MILNSTKLQTKRDTVLPHSDAGRKSCARSEEQQQQKMGKNDKQDVQEMNETKSWE